MRTKDLLLFGRIHTAALTMPLFISGYLFAGGDFWSWQTLFWALFGVVFHFNGMMVNNILDLPYDMRDPHKQHFPLVSGRISLREAWTCLLIGHAIGLAMIFWLSSGTWAWSLGLSFLLFGWLYNMECKTHPLRAPLWNCITTMLVPAFSFYSTTDHLNWMACLLFLYTFLLAAFQIGYEGSMKDMQSDRTNLGKLLGARVEGGYFHPSWALPTGVALRVAMLFVSLLIAEGLSFYSTAVLGFLMVLLSALLLRRRRWNHRRVLKELAINEITMYFVLLSSFSWLIGLAATATLVVTMVLWFLAWNRFYWGTAITPVV
jgi:4-hydroxybenzoate polyprenyltransferase